MLVSEIAALPVFPYADRFRYLPPKELLELGQAIYKNGGPRQPLVIWRGQLLDGRNRLRAIVEHCPDLVEVAVVEEFFSTELEAVEYVRDVNVLRRENTYTERVVAAVEAFSYYAAEAKARTLAGKPAGSLKGRTTEVVGLEFGIGRGTVAKAQELRLHSGTQDLWAAVCDGTLEIRAALEQYALRIVGNESRQTLVRKFPELWEAYQRGDLGLQAAYVSAQKADAALKERRDEAIPEALLRIEVLVEHPAWKEANLGIGKLQTVEDVEKFKAELETIRERLYDAEWAADVRLTEIENEGKMEGAVAKRAMAPTKENN